jgi:Phage Mu protein F like protein
LPPPPKPPAPPSVPPTPPPSPGPGDDGEPIIRFPGLEESVKRLREKQVLSSEDYYQLTGVAKQSAFTISGDLTDKSIDKIRMLLGDILESGPSLREFSAKVHEAIDELPISESHLESVYRNAVNEGYSQGIESVLDHPLVGEAFPYAAFHAIHDARVRPDHLALETQGLNGTNIYRRDDPVWKALRPPFSWMCRCGFTAISIETAASMGVKEAIRWRDSGEPPEMPEFVPWPTYEGQPILPPPGWSRAA